jgi:hypothetical protein
MTAEKKKEGVPVTVIVTDENVFSSFDDYEPSVTVSVFVYWILPVLAIAFMSRFLVDPHAASGLGIGRDAPIPNKHHHKPVVKVQTTKAQAPPVSPVPTTPTISATPVRPKKKEEPLPTFVADKPTSYIEAVKAIRSRRLNWDDTDSSSMATSSTTASGDSNHKPTPAGTTTATSAPRTTSSTTKAPRGASTDPMRNQLRGKIDGLRDVYKVCMHLLLYSTLLYSTLLVVFRNVTCCMVL